MAEIIHGRFEVVRSLGMGGMGLIVEARDRVDGRHVALKQLRPMDLMQQGPRARFRREAEAMTGLHHPHIVEMLGWYEEPPAMVLELLHGETVRAALKRETTLSLTRACLIGSQIASALSAAHASGAVHRDVKPSNIFLVATPSRRTHAKLLDFGVAKIEDAAPLTLTNASVGSALYMSPEQVRGEPVDDRSDTYALGVCLYEMITGHLPYADATLHQAMVRLLAGDPLPEDPTLPPGLYAVLVRATSLAPERRYQSAQELERALGPFTHAETPRTQLSAAITAPDSSRTLEHAPSSGSKRARPVTAQMASVRPHFEPPAPASMTAPLTTLNAQRAQSLVQTGSQPRLPASAPGPRAPASQPQNPASWPQPSVPPSWPHAAQIPHTPPSMPRPDPPRVAATPDPRALHRAQLARTIPSGGTLLPQRATPKRWPWLVGGAATLSLGVGAAALVWTRTPAAPMPLAEPVATLDAAILDAPIPEASAVTIAPLVSLPSASSAPPAPKRRAPPRPTATGVLPIDIE